MDTNGELTKQFHATITPEVFVTDENKMTVYSGRVDDSYYRIGKRRKIITSTDLDDALLKIINNQKVEIAKTQAVGCLISLSK
jgi:hypothetical protein